MHTIQGCASEYVKTTLKDLGLLPDCETQFRISTTTTNHAFWRWSSFLLLTASFKSFRMWCLCFNNFLSETSQRPDPTLSHYSLKCDRRILSVVTQCDVKNTSSTSLEQQYVFHMVRGTKEAAHILLVEHRPNWMRMLFLRELSEFRWDNCNLSLYDR